MVSVPPLAIAGSIMLTASRSCVHRRFASVRGQSNLLTQQRLSLRCLPPVVNRVDLRGEWEKDKENSDLDAYGQMLSLIGLTGLKKTGALKLINGLVIEQKVQPPQLIVRYVVSRVQFLPQTVESFEFGQRTQMPRRDGQPGVQTATAQELENSIQTNVTWDKPNPGT